MAKKIDLSNAPVTAGTLYPPPFDEPCRKRRRVKVGDAVGLTQFGVNLCTLPPGAWSSQRHWHDGEDELLVMLTGSAILIEDDGETEMGPGDIAVWPKGVSNGHHLINRGTEPCSFVCVSAGTEAGGAYSDIDMKWTLESGFVHKDGTPY
jgi:uncharacterized cupin superfamily protein